ncbi:MAG: SIS domain-containing protein [Erysipelotrichaceae bacterium]|nr:SIS domain-containing protein [Erysipelotrichaceae bacterium]
MQNNESIMWKEIFQQPEAVFRTLEINRPLIMNIAKAVHERQIKTIILAGRGSSEHACQVARYLFETKCRMVASIAAPSVITHYDGNIDLANVLTIGVSQSGAAQDIYEVMNETIKQHGLCVSITNVRDSIMAGVGDFRMNLECGEEKSITAAKSYLTQLTLLVAIAGYISQDQGIIDLLDNLPKIIQKALLLEPQVKHLVTCLRNTDSIMIIGRGLLYGLSLETELKIQETCYLDARAYASSDYRHGPIATCQRFVPVIFFIADQQTNECVLTLHERMKKEYSIFSIAISNLPASITDADIAIKLPVEYDGLSAVFVCAVFSQMLACQLSLARGYNPDTPIGVSKRTVTR